MIRQGLARFLQKKAHPTRVSGSIIEAPLSNTFIGERCIVQRSLYDDQALGKAQTIGLTEHAAILSLIGESQGISRDCVVMPSGYPFSVEFSSEMLGCLMNAEGELVSRFGKSPRQTAPERCGIDRLPPNSMTRVPIRQPLVTGIRAIDGLLTCGQGQRIGIFAPAGGGKTTLMSMLVRHVQADAYVVGLVGERGREVAEFVQYGIAENKRDCTSVVYASSDRPPVERCNAALVATTLAEYLRDQGMHVVLLIDSMTRYARGLRDVALTAGEPPAKRGYPASVFEELPKILERSGITDRGCITAFYTVLLEEEDDVDPIGDEVRSILDGHIYLSRTLAGRGHYPAIDILRSVSRVAAQVATPGHIKSAGRFRELMGRLDELQLLLDMGEYRPGENPKTDAAMKCKAPVAQFLQQAQEEYENFKMSLKRLSEIAAATI